MIAALLISLAAAQPQVPAASTRLPPVDQCAADASFAAFRTRLLEAIAHRDHAYILSIIPEYILVNFGGDRGREDFARNWRLDQSDSPFWNELQAALALGCASFEDEFVSPSLGVQLAEDHDPFDVVVAVRAGAALRARPEEAAEAVATLDWDVLRMRGVEAPDDWIAVRRADGREGFVRRTDVRSPLDYRAHFAKANGHWQMYMFIAGD